MAKKPSKTEAPAQDGLRAKIKASMKAIVPVVLGLATWAQVTWGFIPPEFLTEDNLKNLVIGLTGPLVWLIGNSKDKWFS